MKHLFSIPALFVLLLLNACAAQYHYVPNIPVIPAFRKQHDAVMSGGRSVMGGWELQAGYSPLKHVLLQYQYAHLPTSSPSNARLPWESNQSWEGSAGAYWYKSPWTFSLAGGGGGGYSENGFGSTGMPGGQSQLDFRQWFVQPAVLLQSHGIRFGLAARSMWLNFEKGQIEVPSLESAELQAIRRIEEENPFRLTEFGFTLGYSLRPFTLSYNAVSVFGDPNLLKDLLFADGNHSVMLTLNVQELWRGKRGKGK